MFNRTDEFCLGPNDNVIELVYPLSRIKLHDDLKSTKEIDLYGNRNPIKRIILGEYLAFDRKVKAMARVYLDWPQPAIAGCPLALRVSTNSDEGERRYRDYVSHSSNWIRDIPTKDYKELQSYLDGTLYEKFLVSFIVPLGIWEQEIKSLLVPYLYSLHNPNENAEGVSLINSLQLHIQVQGLASYSVKVDRIENCPEYIERVNSLGTRVLDKVSYLATQEFRYDINKIQRVQICTPSKDANFVSSFYHQHPKKLDSKLIVKSLDPSYKHLGRLEDIDGEDIDINKYLLEVSNPFRVGNKIYIPI